MSRLKLFLLILIVAVLGIVFVQNREPLALKILCPDNAQSCVYQTPRLPLAIWIGLFTLGGAIAGLLGQTLSRYRYAGSGKQKYIPGDEEKNQRWSRKDEGRNKSEDRNIQDSDTSIYATDYEKPQEPQSVERSGSSYSYKYKDKKGENNNVPKVSREDINLNKDDDGDWI